MNIYLAIVVVLIVPFLFLTPSHQQLSDDYSHHNAILADETLDARPTRQNILPSGKLLFLQGTTLKVFDVATSETTSLANNVEFLYPSPTNKWVIFQQIGQTNVGLFMLNPRTLEVVQFDTLRTKHLFVVLWSPDENWFIYQVISQGVQAFNPETGTLRSLEHPTADTEYAWLGADQVIIIDVRRTQSSVSYNEVTVVNLFTEVESSLDIDLESFQNNSIDFNIRLQQLGATITSVPFRAWPLSAESDQLCNQWAIYDPLADEPVYQAVALYKITDLFLDTNRTLWFLEWILPDCDISEQPIVKLKTLNIDLDVVTIAESVFPGVSIGERPLADPTSRYSLSPDQNFVAWITGSIQDERSAIVITDLSTGEEQVVLSESDPINPSAFITELMYYEVIWLN